MLMINKIIIKLITNYGSAENDTNNSKDTTIIITITMLITITTMAIVK